MKDRGRLPRATLEQKIQILDYFHSSDRPQLDTVEKFKDMVAISTLTFNEWVKRELEYRERYKQLDSNFEKNLKRKSSYKYDKINKAMDLLVQQRLKQNQSVTEPLLRKYWQMYAHQFGVDNPKRLISFSHGWLSQFKKRHGLLRKKGLADADLTTFTNERLLVEPLATSGASEDYSGNELGSSDELDGEESRNRKSRRQGNSQGSSQFRPQDTLSFQAQFPYTERNLPQRREESTNANSLASAMSLSMAPNKTPTAGDIEKFLFNVADEFFNEHQYEYPQTIKMYHEFKSSFLSERLIDLRSSGKESETVNRSDGSAQNEKLLLDHKLLNTQQFVSKPPEKRRRLESSHQLSHQLRHQLPQPNVFSQSSSSRLGNSEILDNMFMRKPSPEGFGQYRGTSGLQGQQISNQKGQKQGQEGQNEESWSNLRKMWERNRMML